MGLQLIAGTDVAAAVETEVRLHAFTRDEAGDHYADFDRSNPDLEWTAFSVRREKDGDVLEMLWEDDFATYELARAAAEAESRKLGLDPASIREY